MTIPERFRPSVRAALDALSSGDLPDMLAWVEQYGADGATLIRQPEEIWEHPDSQIEVRSDGSAWGVVPLWTTDENPSDLSAEFALNAAGRVEIRDVYVL